MVARLVAISGGGNKTTYSTITAEYDVGIQRLNKGDEQKVVSTGGAVGKYFRLYCEEDADIQEGDKLVDENSYEYKVFAIQKPSILGNFVHKEAIIFKVK